MQARWLILMTLSLAFARTLPAQQASSHTLVFAVYRGEATAEDVLASMRKAQQSAGERIESYALVAKSPNGKIAVHERPAEPNPAIQVMLGSLSEPSGGMAAGANVIDRKVVDSLRASLTPGTSALIAVLDDRWVRDVQRELRGADARAMMFTRIPEGASDDSR